MSAGPTEKLLEICDDALGRLGPGPAAEAVTGVRGALVEPLRVAVAGRVSSGKSTLVNALIGERIAQTAVGECTKLVAWFRYGDQERIEVHPRAGEPIPLPLGSTKAMPDDIVAAAADAAAAAGRPGAVATLADISYVSVYLTHRLLADLTIIDTPGLLAVTGVHSDRTEQFLGFDDSSNSAIAGADALIYLSAAAVRLDAKQNLDQYRAAFRGGNLSALNAVAVLTRFDTISADLANPWPDGRRVAEKYARQFRSVVADFLPVICLLAETTATHGLTESDAADLEALCPKTASDRLRLLAKADWFTAPDLAVDVPAERRTRLMALLGVYGLHMCFDLVGSGVRGAAALEKALREEFSGICALEDTVHGTFARNAGPVKAGAALAKLERVSYLSDPDNASGLRLIRKALEAVRLDPEMHQLEQSRCMQLIAAGEAAQMSAEEHEELRRLTTETEPAARLGLAADATAAELTAAARERASAWQGREALAFDRGVERTARMAKVAYSLLAQDLHRAADEPPSP